MPEWTASQREAIKTRTDGIIVAASAGSGKTSVMIERIVDMITIREASIDNILVLTFTNASAADMRRKLKKKLTADLELASIGTFHKFCGDLVRTHFACIGVDPGFKIMDEADAKQTALSVLDRVITKNYDRATAVIDTFCAGRKTDSLKQIILDITSFLESRADADDWLEKVALGFYNPDPSKNPAIKIITQHYKMAGNYFHAKFNQLLITAIHDKAEKVIPFIEHAINLSKQLCDPQNTRDYGTMPAMNSGTGRNFSAHAEFKRLRNELKNIYTEIDGVFNKDAGTIGQQLLRSRGHPWDCTILVETIYLVRQFIAEYATEKQSARSVDFSDLERFTSQLLSVPEVLSGIREKYKFIFVDEYQDTNPVQNEILRTIACDGGPKMFVVGDLKQSIYGFRGAQGTIFADKMTEYRANDDGCVVHLNQNFRSNPGILSFVNHVFEKIMTNETASVDYANDAKFDIKGQATTDENPAVEIILVKQTEATKSPEITKPYDLMADEGGTEDLRTVEAQAAITAERITHLVDEGVNYSDIAILARSSTHFETLKETLKNAAIPYTIESKQRLSERFEIALLNNFLFAASNAFNDVPLVLTMQSHIFNFTPDDLAKIKIGVPNDHTPQLGPGGTPGFYERILDYIKKLPDTELCKRLEYFVQTLTKYNTFTADMPVAEILSHFVTEFHVTEQLLLFEDGFDMAHNIKSFINRLRNNTQAESCARYLYLVENGLFEIDIDGGPGGDRVQIMTMHKSKGLEFPVVIIFDVSSKFSTQDTRKMIMIGPDTGLAIFSTDLDDYSKRKNPARLASTIRAKQIQIAEEMRLLYVALTRAKTKLIIIGRTANNSPQVGGVVGTYEILSSSNYLDFLAPTIFRPVKECNFNLSVIPLDQIEILNRELPQTELTGAVDEKLKETLQNQINTPVPITPGRDAIYKNSVSSLTKHEENLFEIPPRVLRFTNDDATCRGRSYGTLFHSAMQKVDFTKPKYHDCKDRLATEVNKCIDVLKPLLAGTRIFQEVPLLQRIQKNGHEILVQGVIDLLALSDDAAIIIDYKTTNTTPEKLLELYAPQLKMYAEAIFVATGLRPTGYIYGTVHAKLVKCEN